METLYTGRLHGFPNMTTSQFGQVPEEGVLSLVVVLATSVSLVALVFAFITYSLFSDLRNLMGTTIMILLATTFMAQLIYVVGVGGVHDKELCLSISFSLQYLHLAAVLWLASLCIESQRIRTDSLVPQAMCLRFFLSCLVCWGVPALAVTTAYAITDTEHLGRMYKVNCWFSEARVYLLTYSFPALSLLTGSACALIRSRVSLEYRLRMEADMKSRTKSHEFQLDLSTSRQICEPKPLIPELGFEWILFPPLVSTYTLITPLTFPNARSLQLMSTSGRLELSLYGRLVTLLIALDICGALQTATNSYVFWVAYNVLHAVQGVLMALSATCNSQVLSVYTRRHRRRRSASRLLSQTSSVDSLAWRPMPNTV